MIESKLRRGHERPYELATCPGSIRFPCQPLDQVRTLLGLRRSANNGPRRGIDQLLDIVERCKPGDQVVRGRRHQVLDVRMVRGEQGLRRAGLVTFAPWVDEVQLCQPAPLSFQVSV